MIAFRPRLLEALQGYSSQRLIKDVGAGLTVGVVALPLAMAFAIASGLKPEAGIITAIVAGFLISALGGSSVQIGGPAGAYIVIVFGIVARYGVANLLLATMLAGVLLIVMGLCRLGNLIRFIPVSIVIGFTNGIAVLIAMNRLGVGRIAAYVVVGDARGHTPTRPAPRRGRGSARAPGPSLRRWWCRSARSNGPLGP